MKISAQLLSEIRDFLQDISTGAPVTDASRDAATEFVALLPEEFDRECEKCGQPTKSEEAWIDGQIWCHPCADLLDQQLGDNR